MLLDPARRAAYDASLDAPASRLASAGGRRARAAPPRPGSRRRQPAAAREAEEAPSQGAVGPATRERAGVAPRRRRGRRPGGADRGRARARRRLRPPGPQRRPGRRRPRRRPRPRPSGPPRRCSPTTTGHLPADRKRAGDYLTDDFGKKYLKNFTPLEKQKDGSPGPRRADQDGGDRRRGSAPASWTRRTTSPGCWSTSTRPRRSRAAIRRSSRTGSTHDHAARTATAGWSTTSRATERQSPKVLSVTGRYGVACPARGALHDPAQAGVVQGLGHVVV